MPCCAFASAVLARSPQRATSPAPRRRVPLASAAAQRQLIAATAAESWPAEPCHDVFLPYLSPASHLPFWRFPCDRDGRPVTRWLRDARPVHGVERRSREPKNNRTERSEDQRTRTRRRPGEPPAVPGRTMPSSNGITPPWSPQRPAPTNRPAYIQDIPLIPGPPPLTRRHQMSRTHPLPDRMPFGCTLHCSI